ncbi:nuclear transcription factor Y subunit B-6-like isoform X2 [Salvia splendens]|uniref:nuclear transcription factor Y subunit B-6-like isoform X2 n=1 Tax=Salvia splendens TaxID=180675 RepID=UPI001C26744E|nr:nuclear transcription factor Y subunit B-6-like isoform X2 [Salvia splendens]
MELGGNNGGFHGYRTLPATSSETSMPPTKQPSVADEPECIVREQDRFMPIANVIRIMRKILPPHAKISDDAKETIQECVSEYISFITSEANERCQREQRKTITAEDVLWAMSKLGFDDYIEPLTVYLHRYREFDGGERGSLRGEPIKRMVDQASLGLHRFPPLAFHHIPQHHAFFGAAPVNFFKDSPNAGPSAACIEPFPHHKEQL